MKSSLKTDALEVKSVPFGAYKEMILHFDRVSKRLWIAIVVLILALVACNVAWIYAWLQYDYESSETTTTETTSTVTVDGKDGIANYIGNDGDIVNGEDSR